MELRLNKADMISAELYLQGSDVFGNSLCPEVDWKAKAKCAVTGIPYRFQLLEGGWIRNGDRNTARIAREEKLGLGGRVGY